MYVFIMKDFLKYNRKLINYKKNSSIQQSNISDLLFKHFEDSYDILYQIDLKIINFFEKNKDNIESFYIDFNNSELNLLNNKFNFKVEDQNLFSQEEFDTLDLNTFVFELYDCKDIIDIKEENFYELVNHSKFDFLNINNITKKDIRLQQILSNFTFKENSHKIFYLNLWALKDIWIFSSNDNYYDDPKLLQDRGFFNLKGVEFNLDEIEYYFDYLNVSNNKKHKSYQNIDVCLFSVNKDLSFINNNIYLNFFFSDFSFDLNKNLTIKEEAEFNNAIFFTHYNIFKNYNLLNFKAINWKIGFSSKESDSDILLYKSADLNSSVYHFDFIFKYSLSFLFIFFIPFLFYSFFELGFILYFACYFFSWTIPEYFFEGFGFKLVKSLLLFFFGETNYNLFFEIFYQPKPIFFFLSQRVQFFIFAVIIISLWFWFTCFFFYVLFNFFFFFINLSYAFGDVDSIYDTMDIGNDEEFEEEIFPEEVPFHEDYHIDDLSDKYDIFITPFDFISSVFINIFQITFYYFLWDLYLSSFFNVGYFLLFVKNLYFFSIVDPFFELFSYIDFFKKYKMLVFFFFFFFMSYLIFFFFLLI